MADPTKVIKRPCSAERLAANRSNSKRSTGPRTAQGRMNSSMNNFQHGMRSTKLLIPGESGAEFDQRKKELLEALAPRDAVERMLAERVVIRNWYRLRGERATAGRVSEIIEEIVAGADDRDAREVDRLAALLEQDDPDPDVVRQLRNFPAGVAYLLEQWSIVHARLVQYLNPLSTQRKRCFKLLGRPSLSVLRDDPVATKWLRIQIGAMFGPDASLEDVAGFLGGRPPEWMPQEEFAIRVGLLRDSLLTPVASLVMFKAYVAGAINELKAHQVAIQEVADRRLQDAVAGAGVEATPAGISVSNYILANERGCDSALRRLEIMRKPDRTGPKRGPQPGPEGGPKPTVATDAQVTVAAAVPADDVAPPPTIEAAEPKRVDEPGLMTAETAANYCAVEAIEEETPAETTVDYFTVEAIEEETPAETTADYFTDEAIEEDTPAEPGAGYEVPRDPPVPGRPGQASLLRTGCARATPTRRASERIGLGRAPALARRVGLAAIATVRSHLAAVCARVAHALHQPDAQASGLALAGCPRWRVGLVWRRSPPYGVPLLGSVPGAFALWLLTNAPPGLDIRIARYRRYSLSSSLLREKRP
jgi:hypothetical protein